jgi:hypothetical protein
MSAIAIEEEIEVQTPPDELGEPTLRPRRMLEDGISASGPSSATAAPPAIFAGE